METPNPQEKPLEFLKREDVRTMAKDVALLREGEAKVEAAKIGEFQTRQQPLAIPQEPLKETLAPIASEVETQPLMGVKRQGLGKLFIRILLVAVILFVIFNALALTYWLSQKEGQTSDVQDAGQQQTSDVSSPQPLITPNPVFVFISTEQIPLQKGGNVIATLQESFTRTHTPGFTRIVIANPDENRVWTVKEFFSGLSIPVPQEIGDNLQEQLTLFLHANSQNKNRLGFAVPIVQGKDIQAALTAWEASLERDFSLFFSFQGQKDSFAVNFFRESVYKGVGIRFQTFSSQDLGLVYAIVNNVFAVASSLESMRAVIDEIQK